MGGAFGNGVIPSLPSGYVGAAYSFDCNQFLAISNLPCPPYGWFLDGNIPAGLSLDQNSGVISGTPTAGGLFNFEIEFAGPDLSDNASLSIMIEQDGPGTSPAITGGPSSGQVGTAYASAVTASGGVRAYTFAITSRSLPPGLMLNAATGAITGTPTAAGSYAVTFSVTDSQSLTASAAYSIVIADVAPTITTAALPLGMEGTAYTAALAAANGTSPYSFNLFSGSLPPGLTLSSSGAISGTPTAAGTFSFVVKVVDADALASTALLTIVIATPAPPASGGSAPRILIGPLLAASGIPALVTLVDVLAVSGKTYAWSEHKALWTSALTGYTNTQYLDYLVGQQRLQLFGSTQTDTATITLQNLSGNTVARDLMTAFATDELSGALIAIRQWSGAEEKAYKTFIGNIMDVEPDEQQITISCEGMGNWSAIDAPPFNIDKSCPLTFASEQCGSTAPTPCDLSYGGCSSINRFAGAVTEWILQAPDVQLVQPPPASFYNPLRKF